MGEFEPYCQTASLIKGGVRFLYVKAAGIKLKLTPVCSLYWFPGQPPRQIWTAGGSVFQDALYKDGVPREGKNKLSVVAGCVCGGGG